MIPTPAAAPRLNPPFPSVSLFPVTLLELDEMSLVLAFPVVEADIVVGNITAVEVAAVLFVSFCVELISVVLATEDVEEDDAENPLSVIFELNKSKSI